MNIFNISALFLATALSFSLCAETPGMIDSLEKILTSQKMQNQKISAFLRQRSPSAQEIMGSKNISISPEYLRNILLYSDASYLKLISESDCNIYTLLQTNLLRTGLGVTKNILVSYTDQFGKDKQALVAKELFLRRVFKEKCQMNAERSKMFKKQSILRTLKELNLSSPTSKKSCTDALSKWQKSPYTPNLCHIAETIKLGKRYDLALARETVPESKKDYARAVSREKDFYQKNLDFSQRTFINNLCTNLYSTKDFCSLYTDDDIWGQIIKGDLPAAHMSYNCNRYFKNSKDIIQTLNACRSKFIKRKDTCSSSIDENIVSIFPRPQCDELSESLKLSRLLTNYQDCPQLSDNEAITNTFRIIQHFSSPDKDDIKGSDQRPPGKRPDNRSSFLTNLLFSPAYCQNRTTIEVPNFTPPNYGQNNTVYSNQDLNSNFTPPTNPSATTGQYELTDEQKALRDEALGKVSIDDLPDIPEYKRTPFIPSPPQKLDQGCSKNVSLDFANLMLRHNEKAWTKKICFTGKITGEEQCFPYTETTKASDPLSEEFILTGIVKKLKSAPYELKCKIIEKEEYKPSLLIFKTGCYIIYDQKKCTNLNCPKSVIYKTQLVESIRYIGTSKFSYFPYEYRFENEAVSSIMEDKLKYVPRPLRNLTDIKFFLKNNKKGIIHGIGCAEELLPSFFQRRSLNQCRPLPFIISGHKNDSSGNILIVTTAFDDAHHPRQVEWKRVFSSIKGYEQIHPLSKWTMYGLRK